MGSVSLVVIQNRRSPSRKVWVWGVGNLLYVTYNGQLTGASVVLLHE